jgi:branched-chain amino acid aminotransferase
MTSKNFIWLNGEVKPEQETRVTLYSHSLQYGVGIFDGIMCYQNENGYNIFKAEEHIVRFIESGMKLGFKMKYSASVLINGINELLKYYDVANYYIRPLLYRHIDNIPLTKKFEIEEESIAIMLMKIDLTKLKKEVSCTLSNYERLRGTSIPVQWKVCSAYTNSYLARVEAEQKGCDDGIMLNSDGYICEASAANIFFISKSSLTTPLINNDIFPGITRRVIIAIAKELNIQVREANIHKDEIQHFDSCFLCATLMEIVPITKIDTYTYNTPTNEIFKLLRDRYNILTKG